MKYKSYSIFFIIVMVGSGIPSAMHVLPFTTPSEIQTDTKLDIRPVIVKFGVSEEEQAAINEVERNFPNAQTIEFSQRNLRRILSNDQPIIWIGHSASNGVLYGANIIVWERFVEYITLSESDIHIIVACNSYEATQQVIESSKIAVGFPSEIDALYGANLASLVIGMLYGIDNKQIDKFAQKMNYREQLSPSDPEYQKLGFSANEAFMRFSKGGIAIMAAIYALSAAYMGLMLNLYAVTVYTSLSAFWNWMYWTWSLVHNPDGITFGSLTNWIGITALFLAAILGRLRLAHQIALGIALAGDTITQIIATLVLIGTVCLAIYLLVTEIPRWEHDYYDSNDIPAEYESSSPPSGGGPF